MWWNCIGRVSVPSRQLIAHACVFLHPSQESSPCKDVTRTFRHEITSLSAATLKETVDFLKLLQQVLMRLHTEHQLPADHAQRQMFEGFKEDHLTYKAFAGRQHEAQGEWMFNAVGFKVPFAPWMFNAVFFVPRWLLRSGCLPSCCHSILKLMASFLCGAHDGVLNAVQASHGGASLETKLADGRMSKIMSETLEERLSFIRVFIWSIFLVVSYLNFIRVFIWSFVFCCFLPGLHSGIHLVHIFLLFPSFQKWSAGL